MPEVPEAFVLTLNHGRGRAGSLTIEVTVMETTVKFKAAAYQSNINSKLRA